jgi:hypothetical protein
VCIAELRGAVYRFEGVVPALPAADAGPRYVISRMPRRAGARLQCRFADSTTLWRVRGSTGESFAGMSGEARNHTSAAVMGWGGDELGR